MQVDGKKKYLLQTKPCSSLARKIRSEQCDWLFHRDRIVPTSDSAIFLVFFEQRTLMNQQQRSKFWQEPSLVVREVEELRALTIDIKWGHINEVQVMGDT